MISIVTEVISMTYLQTRFNPNRSNMTPKTVSSATATFVLQLLWIVTEVIYRKLTIKTLLRVVPTI